MAKFTQKQIAAQSGLSLATIDRALHHRGQVHPQTLHRIQQALADLELLQKSGLAQGRTIYFDVIMHTPERFSELVREALSSQLASFNPFRIQLRFNCYEDISEREMNALLKKCALSSHGVILKAMNSPSLVSTIDALLKRRVPVVTIVTDIPSSARLRYIGMDNVDAGKAAAFLMSKWLGADSTQIAAVTGSNDFIGERERIAGFISGIEQFAPRNSINVVAGGLGIDHQMYACLCQYLDAHPHTEAVYTVGGGNAGIIRAFAERNRRIKTFIGHDFDRENRALMQAGKIDALIEHNLQLDAQTAFRSLLAFHGFIPEGDSLKPYSRINIITRFNMYT
ncbi:LacI family DNA-binding transcriptional regulator [Raoultella planticola]|nr:LacI family DNA-binding transcriptional regulator [Raoultella planticola]EJR0353215.1 LacI family DNA-binding transcriptional regulator [Raoultella planticola]